MCMHWWSAEITHGGQDFFFFYLRGGVGWAGGGLFIYIQTGRVDPGRVDPGPS